VDALGRAAYLLDSVAAAIQPESKRREWELSARACRFATGELRKH
jgi:hypothetical protein